MAINKYSEMEGVVIMHVIHSTVINCIPLVNTVVALAALESRLH